MIKRDPVQVFLDTLRDSVPDAEHVFSQGNCFRLYLILRQVFPTALPYYQMVEGHVYIKINGIFYDIRGRYKHQKALGASTGLIYMPDEPNIFRKAHRWRYDPGSFSLVQRQRQKSIED